MFSLLRFRRPVAHRPCYHKCTYTLCLLKISDTTDYQRYGKIHKYLIYTTKRTVIITNIT